MINTPEEMEQHLDDEEFLSYVGEQEYARMKPLYDKINEHDKD